MTLNNLAEQLPWLLRNPLATRPTPQPAAAPRSAAKTAPSALHGLAAEPASSSRGDAPFSGSSTATASGTPASSRTTATASSAYPALPLPRPAVAPAPVSASARAATAIPPPVLPRPVSPPARTPARSRAGLAGGAMSMDAVPAKTPAKTPSKTPKKTSKTPAPSSLRRAKTPAHPSPYLPDFGSDINLEDFDSIVDLTTDGADSTDGKSPVFSSAHKRPPANDARLPPPLPPPKQTSRGKKRKSGDISGSPSAKASEKRREQKNEHDKENTDPAPGDAFDDEFDDSGTNFPDVNELLGFGLSSPITQRRKPTQAPRKSPLHPPAEQPQPPPAAPKAPATPPKRRKRFSDHDDVVMDSEDEFATPPTRNTSSFVTCPNESALADAADDASSPSDVPASPPTAAVPSVAERRAAGPDSAVEVEAAIDMDDDPVGNEDMEEATQRPSILAYWPALRWRQQGLEKQIQKNTADYTRALREKWTPARRLQIKGEKEPLLKEKQLLDDLVDAVRAYARLFDDQETLFHDITVAYQSHQDTEADEQRLDELSSELQEREMTLRAQLSSAAIDPASVPNDFDAGSPHNTVVPATQVADGYVPPILSRNDTGVPDSPSQVVLQTQLTQPAPPPPPRTANAPPDGFPDEEFDDDFFNEMENLPQILGPGPGAGPAQTHNSGYASRRSPDRPAAVAAAKRGGAAQDFFSDFSDDVEMLQAAEDFEQQHSSGSRAAAASRPPSASSRPALTPTSGNAGTPYPSTRAAAMTTASTTGMKAVVSGAGAGAGASASQKTKAAFPPELMRFPWSQDVRRALKDRFRMSGFRHNQLEAINATLSGKDAFVLMPTGGGKSLCYMLPAVISSGRTRGVTIVISPLLSLMQDQVDHLKKLNIAASAFTSGTSQAARQHVLALFSKPHPEHFLQLLYVSPEMVNMSTQFCNGLAMLYRNGKLARLVIDEAHCVSQWGHDFRPDYKAIGQVRQRFPTVPVMALTATATSNVIADIQHNLRMHQCQVFSQSFNRPNLYYEVRKKGKFCVDSIAELIKEKYMGQTGIVYTLSQKSTVAVAEKLQTYGLSAHHYHAGIGAEEKTQVQRDWQQGRIKIVVATIAFGMGIDKPDVRFVIHHYLPKSLEGYYQETGRAGRDGQHSDCYLYFGGMDIRNLRKFITDSTSSMEQKTRQHTMLNRMIDYCENTRDCRRTEILRYFGEDFDPAGCGGTCDNCQNGGMLNEAGMADVTACAVAALRVVQAYRTITMAQCSKILLGTDVPEHAAANQYHGAAKHLRKQDVNNVIIRLLGEAALREEQQINPAGIAIQHYSIGPHAHEYFAGKRTLKIVIKVGEKKAKSKAGSKAGSKAAAGSKGDKTPVAKKTKKAAASKKGKEVVAGPASRKKRTGAAAAVLDEADVDGDDMGGDGDDSEGEAYDGPLHANGYAKDAFVVSDNDHDSGADGSSDMDDDFAPQPVRRAPPPKKKTPARQGQQQLQLQQYAFNGAARGGVTPQQQQQQQQQRQRRLEELGGPIARDARLAEAQVTPIHADTIAAFVDEARRLEEKLRNEKGLRILFTESHLREMAIGWTDTVDKMLQIRAVDPDHVRRFGAKFVPLIRRYHALYCEMMGLSADAGEAPVRIGAAAAALSRRSPPPPAGLVAEFVDLISSDEEAGNAEDIDDDDDDDDDGGPSGETASKYFAAGADARESAEAAQWRAQLETLQSQSGGRSRSGGGGGGGRAHKSSGGGSSYRGGGGRGGKFKKGGAPRNGGSGGGGGRKNRPAASGVTKPARKTSSSTAFGGGSASRGGGSSSGGGMSRIGMMPL